MQDYIGQQIDRYRIIERLGMGGMAVVYKAYDLRLEREVALKLIRTEAIPPEQYARLMKRFEREAKAQARFDHKHIVHVYDYGEIDAAPYFVMAHIPGGTLKSKIGQRVDWRQALHWLIPIADALDYAHKQGIVHRDIKPSNILFDGEGQPVLTDFGIAKLLATDEATLTGTGMGVGTPEYMAPEQWRGQAFPASDQFAFGVVLYELLTGQKPYAADTPAAVAIQQATEPLRSPRALAPDIPEEVENLLYKALAKAPQDRYVDMAAFRTALEQQLVSGRAQVNGRGHNPVPEPLAVVAEPDLLAKSEAETVDELESTPFRSFQARAPAQQARTTRKAKTGLPGWAWWAGGASLLVIIICVGSILVGGASRILAPTSEVVIFPTLTPTANFAQTETFTAITQRAQTEADQKAAIDAAYTATELALQIETTAEALASEAIQNAQATMVAEATAIARVTATVQAKDNIIRGFEFYDPFNNNNNDWQIGEVDNDFWRGEYKISNGAFILQADEVKQPLVTRAEFNPMEDLQDFDVAIKARVVEGTIESACYGIAFRESSDGYYVLSVCNSDAFRVDFFNYSEGWVKILEWQYDSKAIRRDDWNLVELRARGRSFRIFINHLQVATFSSSHSESGSVSIVFTSYEEIPFIIAIDFFSLQPR